MRHRVNKIKFSKGKDAGKMMVRKLAKNFLTQAKIETTLKRVKVLKPVIERMVDKSKVFTEANKTYLLKLLNDSKLVDKMFNEIGKALKGKIGGYVRIVRLGAIRDDGAEIARLEWAYPIVSEVKTQQMEPKKVKKPEKTAPIKPAAK